MRNEWQRRYGQWALITGASSGLGREFAIQCAERGLNVVLTARRTHRLEQLASECNNIGVDTLVVPLDLQETNSLNTLVNVIGEREIGLLINNAGFGVMGYFNKLDLQTQLDVIKLNCQVPVIVTHTFLPIMHARKRGGIINVSSIAGFHGNPLMTTYGSAKAFSLCFSEGLWCEMKGSGVDILTLCPGMTQTEFIEKAEMAPPKQVSLLNPSKVVSDALDSLGNKALLVCGIDNKFFIFLHRLLPRKAMSQFKFWLAKKFKKDGR